MRLLDSQTLQHIGTLKEHAARDTAAFGVAISPTSPLLATSGQDGAVLLWDFRKIGNGPLAEWDDGHVGAVHSLAFVAGVSSSGGGGGSGNGELLVSGGTERRLRIHETRTASLKVEGTASVLDSVLCVKAAPAAGGGTAGPRVATAGGSGIGQAHAGISLWRVEEKAQLQAQAALLHKRNAAKTPAARRSTATWSTWPRVGSRSVLTNAAPSLSSFSHLHIPLRTTLLRASSRRR